VTEHLPLKTNIMENPFLDSTKTNTLMDRHLMGEKTAKDPIGEIWCVPSDDGTSPIIVKVNNIVCEKLGYTAYEMQNSGMLLTSLMTRSETIKIHLDKYFKEAFKSAEKIVMRSHGQGFQLKKKDGGIEDVWLAIVFPKENPALLGKRMIPRQSEKPFVYGCLRVIFKSDFGKTI